MTYIKSPINPPLDAKIRLNDQKVKVISVIQVAGCTKNEVKLPDGTVREVQNSDLIF